MLRFDELSSQYYERVSTMTQKLLYTCTDVEILTGNRVLKPMETMIASAIVQPNILETKTFLDNPHNITDKLKLLHALETNNHFVTRSIIAQAGLDRMHQLSSVTDSAGNLFVIMEIVNYGSSHIHFKCDKSYPLYRYILPPKVPVLGEELLEVAQKTGNHEVLLLSQVNKQKFSLHHLALLYSHFDAVKRSKIIESLSHLVIPTKEIAIFREDHHIDFEELTDTSGRDRKKAYGIIGINR